MEQSLGTREDSGIRRSGGRYPYQRGRVHRSSAAHGHAGSGDEYSVYRTRCERCSQQLTRGSSQHGAFRASKIGRANIPSTYR